MIKTSVTLLLVLNFALLGCDSHDKTTKGQMEEFIAIADTISIKYKSVLPVSAQDGSGGVVRTEIEVQGAWLKFLSESGQVYILRILPECRYFGDSRITIGGATGEIETRAQAIGPSLTWLASKEERQGKDWIVIPIYGQDRVVERGERIPFASKLQCSIRGSIRNRQEVDEEMSNNGRQDLLRNLPTGMNF